MEKPVTTNKNGKPRKKLDDDALAKLAKAREIARVLANEKAIETTEKKLESRKNKFKTDEDVKNEEAESAVLIDDEPTDNQVEEEVHVEEPKEEPKKDNKKELKEPKKKTNKKTTKIIVEQSSDDSDEFEPNDHVIFVKRTTKKNKEKKEEKKEEQKEEKKEELVYPGSPGRNRTPPQQRQPSQRELMLQDSYNNMFSGNFLNNNPMRRRF